jgi:hypothetical protein
MAARPPYETAADRLSEVAEILAAGLMRLQARKSSSISATCGDISLDISATESGHPTRKYRRKADG